MSNRNPYVRYLGLALLFLTATLARSTPATAAVSVYAPAEAIAVAAPANTVWCLAGAFNGWNNASHQLYDDGTFGDLFAGDGVHSRDLTIADAGYGEFKVVECGNWGNAFPPENAWHYTNADDKTIKFVFDTNDRSTDAGWSFHQTQNVISVWDDLADIGVTAVGDWQGWNASNPATELVAVGNGIYHLAYIVEDAGTYQAKFVRTGTFNGFYNNGRIVDHGAFGVYNFTTTTDDEEVVFIFDIRSGRTMIANQGSSAGNWCLRGDFNGWNDSNLPMVDDGTGGDLLGGDGIFTYTVTFPTPDFYAWKVAECGGWANEQPAHGNAWFITTEADQEVSFTINTNDHSGDAGPVLLPTQNIIHVWADEHPSVTAIGDFQGWNNSNPATELTNHGMGWHTGQFTVASAAAQSGKVVMTGVWDGWGATGRSNNPTNVDFTTTVDDQEILVYLDQHTGRLNLVPIAPTGGASHDNNIWWGDLGHNSRDDLFRKPGGAVTTNTVVTLRLRAASGDLTGATVRIYNDLTNTQSLLAMTRVADDGTYEWWEYTLDTGADPTIYWYRFIAFDGTATAYYEDDPNLDGGWGQVYGTSPDRSYQLTVYDPAFQTPDWVKDGVMYQIFVERFRDGDPSNNPGVGEFHYDIPGGSIVRSNDPNGHWNAPICDPRDAGDPDCFMIYGQNFYGGDLQGIIDKLDYLQDLGVTILYLNPIFLSPSNHKYDTTDFMQVDPAFGTNALFEQLTTEAHNRDMYIVLDGVFNHTSSDSIYFDRYSRYGSIGACEDEAAFYRNWFYFSAANPPGTGPCAGDTTYESWFGYDSLPKLVSSNPQVRNYFYAAGGVNSVATYWLGLGADGWRLDVGGDVDPGLTNDPSNMYWEGFRSAVRSAHPTAYIVGEEWGNSTAWTLGNEWDASMNYQLGSAIMSFWRDSTFVDNDHNANSSAGILAPLTPSQLDSRLHGLMERYPPETFFAMMNLLGSHDTNRALFMLDHNVHLNDRSLYEDPNYDWSDAITRLKGVVLLQMTLPGSPTIYYGDEVGLVGPTTYDGSTWQDDPYNRLPYPWLDETGTPYYDHLQTQGGQDDLLDYYKQVIAIRHDNAALRTGSFITLLTDDTNSIYAYARLLDDRSNAAIVILNPTDSPQDVTLDVGSLFAIGTVFDDGMTPLVIETYTVAANGEITVTGVPANSGAILVTDNVGTPPDTPTNLAVMGVSDGQVDLEWDAATGADEYHIYRSLVSGGGFAFVDSTPNTDYSDTGLANAIRYYYHVVSYNTTTGLASDPSNEVNALPTYDLTGAWYNLQWPPTITHTISAVTPTPDIYGQIYIDGVTNPAGQAPFILAQVGYGPSASDPATWTTWVAMTYNGDAGNNDEYVGNLLPDEVGVFDYLTRYSVDGGMNWVYGSLTGPGTTDRGELTVDPSGDTDAPAAPQNLTLDGTTPTSVSLSWDANTEVDLHGYELYRQETANPGYTKIATVADDVTSFVDLNVTQGVEYEYYLLAFDTSFNRSAESNHVIATAEARLVEVTFRVQVPSYTPGTVYIVGDADIFGPWNPGKEAMTEIDPNVWEYTTDLLDGTVLNFKFTRGNWDTVEAWGAIVGLTNRVVTIEYGSDGTQLIDMTADDWGNGDDDTKAVQLWRDPLVTAVSPADEALDVTIDTTISVTFSIPVTSPYTLTVTGPGGSVAGSHTYDSGTNTVTFTPDADLDGETLYTVSVTGQSALGGGQQVPFSSEFTTAEGAGSGVWSVYLPILTKP